MSSGCLIVGSRTAPVEEVIEHGCNGLLVDFFDTAALADTIGAALADPAAYAPLRAQARTDMITRYDLRTMCLPQHIELVETLARGETPDSTTLAA
jgi:glycosyltransferase involved in cell wall biosynthesis